jgi:hypothetical protein
MIEKPKVVVHKERSVHTYSELWHASRCVLESGLEQPKGSTWQFLSSIVLTAFTLEAYLNHVGARTFDCWKHLDRLSPLSKLELLCETLGVKFEDGPGARPLQTVAKLLDFRNTIAHGRSEEIKGKPEVRLADDRLDAYLGQQPLTSWERPIQNADFALRAREDVEAVLTKLQEARTDEKEYLFTFGMGAHGATLINQS